jgi:GNAT superfamily N-acetyltransferase
VNIRAVTIRSDDATRMVDALWSEIQERYGFEAPNPLDLADFEQPGGGFWIAVDGEITVGSVGVIPRDGFSELEAMYVAPDHRRRGVARLLLQAAEAHAVATGATLMKLRAGDPQPEALAFYESCGYRRTDSFGQWTNDPTAICFEKVL